MCDSKHIYIFDDLNEINFATRFIKDRNINFD